MDGGYCRFPRAMLALDPVEYNLLAFLIHSAAWKPQRKEVPGGPGRYVELHRGEVAVGLGFLATATARTTKQVRGGLDRLVKKRRLTRLKRADLPANLCSVYLVENYDLYNGKKEYGADQRADCGQTVGRLPPENQELARIPGEQRISEVKKEEKKTGSPGSNEGGRQGGEEESFARPWPSMSPETRARLANRRSASTPVGQPLEPGPVEASLTTEQTRELEEELARVRAHHQACAAARGRVQ